MLPAAIELKMFEVEVRVTVETVLDVRRIGTVSAVGVGKAL